MTIKNSKPERRSCFGMMKNLSGNINLIWKIELDVAKVLNIKIATADE